MIDPIELQPIKIKFARMISRLYTDAKFPIDNINDSLIKSDILDCFENNHPEIFMRMSTEVIAEKLGAGIMKFNEELNAELYWSGIQYMNIFLNKMIPLKQLLILIPIRAMIEKFKVYHEMNDVEMLKAYDTFPKNNILKSLRKQSNQSIHKLSYITGIPENSLKRYEKNNTYLFNASFDNIYVLSKFFKVDPSVFQKKTAFIPYSEYLWNDQNFTSELKKQICNAFNIKEDIYLIREADSLNNILKENKRVAVIEPISFLYTSYTNRLLKKHLDEDLILKAIYNSICYAIEKSSDTNAYF